MRNMLEEQLAMPRGQKSDENEKDRQMVEKQMNDLKKANELEN